MCDDISHCCHRLARTVLEDVYGSVMDRYDKNNRYKSFQSSDDDIPSAYSMSSINISPNARRSQSMKSLHRISNDKIPFKKRIRDLESDRPSSEEELRVIGRHASLRSLQPNAPSHISQKKKPREEFSDIDFLNVHTGCSLVKWPTSNEFKQTVGKRKIMEFIEKRWPHNEQLRYTVELLCVVPKLGFDRYKYLNRWTNSYAYIDLFFNIDVSTVNKMKRVSVSYSFPKCNKIYRLCSPIQPVIDYLHKLDSLQSPRD